MASNLDNGTNLLGLEIDLKQTDQIVLAFTIIRSEVAVGASSVELNRRVEVQRSPVHFVIQKEPGREKTNHLVLTIWIADHLAFVLFATGVDLDLHIRGAGRAGGLELHCCRGQAAHDGVVELLGDVEGNGDGGGGAAEGSLVGPHGHAFAADSGAIVAKEQEGALASGFAVDLVVAVEIVGSLGIARFGLTAIFGGSELEVHLRGERGPTLGVVEEEPLRSEFLDVARFVDHDAGNGVVRHEVEVDCLAAADVDDWLPLRASELDSVGDVEREDAVVGSLDEDVVLGVVAGIWELHDFLGRRALEELGRLIRRHLLVQEGRWLLLLELRSAGRAWGNTVHVRSGMNEVVDGRRHFVSWRCRNIVRNCGRIDAVDLRDEMNVIGGRCKLHVVIFNLMLILFCFDFGRREREIKTLNLNRTMDM